MEYELLKNCLINLCDRPFGQITEFRHHNDMKILIGSYTCTNYFRKLLVFFEEKNNVPENFDIVLPTFNEESLMLYELSCFHKLISKADKIVVNDFGALMRTDLSKIRLGRLINKEYRDRRYSEYDSSEYFTKFDVLVQDLKSMGFDISEAETDIITKQFVTSSMNGTKLYYHFPYRQISSCHICEFASVGKKIEDKFQPDDVCSMQCHQFMIYTEKEKYFKYGKSVYDILSDDYLQNINENIIFTPRWNWYDENNGSFVIF